MENTQEQVLEQNQSQSQEQSQPWFSTTTESGAQVNILRDGTIVGAEVKEEPVVEAKPEPAAVVETPIATETQAQPDRIKELEEEVNRIKSNPTFGLLEEIETNPQKIGELTRLISTDFDKDVSDMDLYKDGWMKQNSYPGVSAKDLQDAYNEHIEQDFVGFDPNEANYGLSGRDLINYKRMVEVTRAANKTEQQQAREQITQLRSVSQKPDDTYRDTPEQRAKVAEFYQEELDKLSIDYADIGIPQGVATLLGPELAKTYKASMVEQVVEKPLLGLERYFTQNENGPAMDVHSVFKAGFILDNMPSIIEKAIAHGRSMERVEFAKEMEGKINHPTQGHTPGGSTVQPRTMKLPDGTLVPI
jgi:hypothetical protein